MSIIVNDLVLTILLRNLILAIKMFPIVKKILVPRLCGYRRGTMPSMLGKKYFVLKGPTDYGSDGFNFFDHES